MAQRKTTAFGDHKMHLLPGYVAKIIHSSRTFRYKNTKFRFIEMFERAAIGEEGGARQRLIVHREKDLDST